MKHAKHGILMVLACVIPLALIFFLPALRLTGNGFAIVAIFGAHLLMMRFMLGGKHGTHSGSPADGDSHAHGELDDEQN